MKRDGAKKSNGNAAASYKVRTLGGGGKEERREGKDDPIKKRERDSERTTRLSVSIGEKKTEKTYKERRKPKRRKEKKDI